jgi:predicted transcriptional regulator
MSILQVLAPPKRLELTTNNIARNCDLSRQHVTRRTRVLVDKGLLEKDGNGHPFYSVTDLGERVVNRDIEVDELREL